MIGALPAKFSMLLGMGVGEDQADSPKTKVEPPVKREPCEPARGLSTA